MAPEHGPHVHQGTEQLSASVPGRGGPEGGCRFPQPPAVPLAPSGLAVALGFFSPASCPSLEEDLCLGGAAGPGTPWLGCVCGTSNIVFLCLFPGSVHSGHQILKGSCSGAGLCGPHRHQEHQEQPAARTVLPPVPGGPLPCPGWVCRGNCGQPPQKQQLACQGGTDNKVKKAVQKERKRADKGVEKRELEV